MFFQFRESLKKDKDMLVELDDSDIDEWYNICGEDMTKTEFRKQVHAMVILHDWYNLYKHGFKLFNRPVKLNKQHKVVEYI